jgi:hypothetical protein
MNMNRQRGKAFGFLMAVVCCCILAQLPCFAATTQPTAGGGTAPTRPAIRLDLTSLLREFQVFDPSASDSFLRELGEKRDPPMNKLAHAITSLPVGQRLECLAIDTLKWRSGSHKDKWVLVYHMEPGDSALEKQLQETGGGSLTRSQWEFLKPFAEKIGTLKEPPGRKSAPEGYETAIVSYYDGSEWRFRLWHDIPNLISERSDEEVVREFSAVTELIMYFCPQCDVDYMYTAFLDDVVGDYKRKMEEAEAQK